MRGRRDGPGHDRGAPQLTSILFVCLGNICRSPTAEGVMRALLRDRGLEQTVRVDSAGTGSWHVGEPPDRRATEAAERRGVTLDGTARQIRREDFSDFDLIVALDREILRELCEIAPSEEAAARVKLLRGFDPASGHQDLDVPDPYYGGDRGFELVVGHIDAACRGLLDTL